VEATTQEIRTMSYLLHPPMLDELGLEYVLPWYIEGFSRRSGISVDLQVPKGFGRLPRDTELALFRITQEALANVRRHSGSDNAHVRLSRQADSVMLEIQDEGRGLPPDAQIGFDRGGGGLGVGLAGMRERVRQLGGTIEVTCAGGTTVRAVLGVPVAESLS
jgi:signal transduction histidine kinase